MSWNLRLVLLTLLELDTIACCSSTLETTIFETFILSGRQEGAVLATLMLKRTIAQGMIEAELYSDIPPARDRIVDRESLATFDYTFALIRYQTRNDGQLVNDGFGTIVLYYQVATLHLPVSMPMLLFAAYPTIAFIRGPLRRWRRRRRGLCTKCGYDLTGNTTGVCPECGTRARTP